ncbi:methyltransferase family protein [Pelagibaculum spongiae]|nr:isoprenylcysteine carboxylmethyltransferase family protein [Pelagibaculum spongiae]
MSASMMRHKLSSWALVSGQGIGMLACLWPFFAGWPFAGLLVLLIGAALGIWVIRHNRIGNFSVFPEPMDKAKLITTGPYRWVRHPMYTALLLTMLGVALINGCWINLLGFLWLIMIIWFKARQEEKLLLQVYDEYSFYQQKTKRLIPGLF